jgi:hypothetical protein
MLRHFEEALVWVALASAMLGLAALAFITVASIVVQPYAEEWR